MQSKTRPELSSTERGQLLDAGFLDLRPRGRARYLFPTNKAWEWAAATTNVTLSSSSVGAEALQALLRKLIPFLAARGLELSDLLRPAAAQPPPRPLQSQPQSRDALGLRIERACLELANGKRKVRVRLSRLREQLNDVGRRDLDSSLLDLQDARRLVLYREDNSAGLTDEDRRAALNVNDEPRHLVMLESAR